MAHLPWAQPQVGSILFKFLLETRLESESFEPLINFLMLLVKKLLSNNKLINLTRGLINYQLAS